MRVGSSFGLQITLFVDVEEYIGLLAPNTGARVAIHEPYLQPIMKTESIAVSTGEATFLALTKRTIHRLDGNYGNCTKTWPENLKLNKHITDTAYSTERCLKYCTLNALLEKCNCSDSYDAKFTSDPNLRMKGKNDIFTQCSHTDPEARGCRDEVYENFAKHELDCYCPVPCDNTDYTYKSSRSNWPSPAYSSYFASSLVKTDVPRIKSYLKRLHNSKKLSQKLIHDSIQENFVRVEIFYDSLRYHVIKEEATFDIQDFFNDFGGSISLWLGWSIFALLEGFIFLLHCAEALYIKYFK
ncbi:degenerin unc-8-like [Convolutriloba macropyga]|uniref:degenerin unc-8-like n=1 Tax=Convolutriloba macropyga TaxID=536237 RepID=UPI003F521BBB